MVGTCEVVVASVTAEVVGVLVAVTGVERTVVSGLSSEVIKLLVLVTATRMCVMLSVAVIEMFTGNTAIVGESRAIDDNVDGIVRDAAVVTGVSIGVDVGVVNGFIVVSNVAILVGLCVLVGANTDTIVGFSEGEGAPIVIKVRAAVIGISAVVNVEVVTRLS